LYAATYLTALTEPKLVPGLEKVFMSTHRIRILCADDHPCVRDGIAFAIQQESDMELVAEAKDGVEAVSAFRQHRPDVALMDLQMPRMNGIDAIATIRNDYPKARIVALSTYSGDFRASRALRVGAAGYILKGMLRTELVNTIRCVYAGHRRIPAEIATQIAEYCSADALSGREIEVLRNVASGCSNKIVAFTLQITEKVYVNVFGL
jgi:DNA-binding NarL/FixJ family response regulator